MSLSTAGHIILHVQAVHSVLVSSKVAKSLWRRSSISFQEAPEYDRLASLHEPLLQQPAERSKELSAQRTIDLSEGPEIGGHERIGPDRAAMLEVRLHGIHLT